MHDRVIDETKKYIGQIMDAGLDEGSNLEYLDKLIDIQKDAYEIKCMKEDKEMYGNYGNYNGYGRGGNYGRDEYGRGSYGRDEYGARSRDSRGRYRGHDHLDRMYEDYGRYMEGRERYGANEDTMRSLQYMLKSMEDFARMLKEEANSEQEVQMIRETAQRIAQM